MHGSVRGSGEIPRAYSAAPSNRHWIRWRGCCWPCCLRFHIFLKATSTTVNCVAGLRVFFIKTSSHQFREFLPYPKDRAERQKR
jgi:hypothetical protein